METQYRRRASFALPSASAQQGDNEGCAAAGSRRNASVAAGHRGHMAGIGEVLRWQFPIIHNPIGGKLISSLEEVL